MPPGATRLRYPREVQVLRHALVFTGREFVAVDVAISGETIAHVGEGPAGARYEAEHDFTGCRITPGFIDLHLHGAVGEDVMDPTDGALDRIGGHLARRGTTSFLATTITTEMPLGFRT